MDASRKIPGSIHDERLIIPFYRLCPVNWVHIKGNCVAKMQFRNKLAAIRTIEMLLVLL